MKIQSVEPLVLTSREKGAPTWASYAILVKVTTSNGLVGWGEAVPTLRVLSVVGAVRQVSSFMRGRDYHRTRENYLEWFRQDFYLTRSFESATAISAVDMASWDLVGKELGTPLYDLLGGKVRDRVPVYANGWYGDCVTPEDFMEATKRVKGLGYNAVKLDPFGSYFGWIDRRGVEEAKGRLRAVADVIGVDGIAVEHHGRFDGRSAVLASRAVDGINPLFIEEPVHHEDVYGLRYYRSQVGLRLALGERLISAREASFYIGEGLVDVVQPDLSNIGGVTVGRDVVAMSQSHDVEVAFHNAFGVVQNAVTVQVSATTPNLLMMESFYHAFPRWKLDLVQEGPRVEAGYSTVPSIPGIGIKLNEKLLEELMTEPSPIEVGEEPVWVVKGTWKDVGRA